MSINPLSVSRIISEEYKRYIKTALTISPQYPDLREQLSRTLENPDLLFRGPYLQGLPPYQKGESLKNLVEAGVLPSNILGVPFLGSPENQLYYHQCETIKKVRKQRNVVLATGTGSGKTLSFLIPIISSILENPQPGTHTMLLYPMNALVNDQLKTMRKLLSETPQVRFGRYVNIEMTPRSEAEARRLYPNALSNEVVSREVFRSNPPHILITNYAMLEYLLLRSKDSPLFNGPWRFVVLDEAHTYTGAKGSEVAFLLRRLCNRVKANSNTPIQYIATSASLGTADEDKKKEVAKFAEDLFDAKFESSDIVEARTYHHIIPDRTFSPKEKIYTSPLLLQACEDKRWVEGLTKELVEAGFSKKLVEEAKKKYLNDFEAALYYIFSRDERTEKLRIAVTNTLDLQTATYKVFSRRDDETIKKLICLVRITSLARIPGGDARLVPCRYHYFVKGINGAYIAFEHIGENLLNPTLLLEPARTGMDGVSKTLELRSCRKCGQPYAFAYHIASDEGSALLSPFGNPSEGRGKPRWLSWGAPRVTSIDEADELDDSGEEGEGKYKQVAFCSVCGSYAEGDTCNCSCGESKRIVPLWLISDQPELRKCESCGGNSTVTSFRVEGESAQAAIAESFYRQLPEAKDKKPRYYPGKGRKLLVFSDSRQSAAYFAPYLENTHTEQKIRWLVYHALELASQETSRPISASTLVDYMVRISDDERLFPIDDDWDEDRIKKECQLAIIEEFCLPRGRRVSLEALGLVSLTVDLGRHYEPPIFLKDMGLSKEEINSLLQELLATLRLQKAITIPAPISPQDERFAPWNKHCAVVARKEKEDGGAKHSIIGFLPARGLEQQRRGAYLKKVIKNVCKKKGKPMPDDKALGEMLYKIWESFIDTDVPGLALERKEVAPGVIGYQIRWQNLKFSLKGKWSYCRSCNQWTDKNAADVCPSFRCNGTLEEADPTEKMKNHHYRLLYTRDKWVPMVAKEHTAQLSPAMATDIQEAFQNGHSTNHGQINVLSCSTTFELGVDLGDLEAVLLRDVPPSPANYQQRAGRAGRGVGTAAFVVTYALSRSHDVTFFSQPEEMINGHIRPPRISLTNEIIRRRHMVALLLSDFFRRNEFYNISNIGSFFESGEAGKESPCQLFLDGIDQQVEELKRDIKAIIKDCSDDQLVRLKNDALVSIEEAKNYYFNELEIYNEALTDAKERRRKQEEEGKASNLGRYIDFLYKRIDTIKKNDWINFFSDRNVLPTYAFPIYNVSLETVDNDVRLDRDLKIALSEYVPGAAVVAKGKLWESVGIKMPPKRALEQKWFICCPKCWHVQRKLERDKLLEDNGGKCPVCEHQGTTPVQYIVPIHGFTTNLQHGGREIIFNRPHKISSSRVLFVPQQESDSAPDIVLGERSKMYLSVTGNENAEFFVFNNGEQGRGFYLCNTCGIKGEPPKKTINRGTKRTDHTHTTADGRQCKGKFKFKNLAHEFKGSATRIQFSSTGYEFKDQSFWLSLMYALLGGMSDALDIERGDIDGVIRPVSVNGEPTQEIVLFDSVPGGAGHVKRLLNEKEFMLVLQAANRRVNNCKCGKDASCYRCLREYRNQYVHDILSRGPVAIYLDQLLQSINEDPQNDQVYPIADTSRFLRRILKESNYLYIVAKEVLPSGPPDIGSWNLFLQTIANQTKDFKLAVVDIPPKGSSLNELFPYISLMLAGVHIYKVKASFKQPPYAILSSNIEDKKVAVRWDTEGITELDSSCHRKQILVNKSQSYLETVKHDMDKWFKENTTLVTIQNLVPSAVKSTYVAAGEPVNYSVIFASAAKEGYKKVIVQDPYLVNEHQIGCLGKFINLIYKNVQQGNEKVQLTLVTKEPNFNDRGNLSKQGQVNAIKQLFAKYPLINLDLRVKVFTDRSVHVRFAYIAWKDGSNILFQLDRGFDMEDQRGLGRGCPIMEYSPVDDVIRDTFFGRNNF